MQRHEASKLADTVSASDLKQMFINAKKGIKDWEKVSRVNKGLTKGTAFNILSAGNITEKTAHIAKTNMIWEFGEWLPNYEKEIKPQRKDVKPTHQEPVDLGEDWFDKLFD
jgi:hypothetical protein